jgi:hypothetical protein
MVEILVEVFDKENFSVSINIGTASGEGIEEGKIASYQNTFRISFSVQRMCGNVIL